MKTPALLLLFATSSFAVCTSTASGNWSAAGTWLGCTGTGGLPGSGDAVIIANAVVLNQSASVTSVTINGAAAELTTDGAAAYTLTYSGGLTITLGCTSAGGGCPTGYALDTANASAGKEVTFTNTGAGYDITSTVGVSTAVNLVHAVLQCGTGGGGCFNKTGANGSNNDVFNFQNVQLVNGTNGINIYEAFPNSIGITINNVSSTLLSVGPMINTVGTSYMLSPCIISNNTMTNSTFNTSYNAGVMLAMDYNTHDFSQCQIFGNAMLSDASGTYYPSFMLTSISGVSYAAQANWYLNLAQSNYTGNGGNTGLPFCPSSSSLHCKVYQNIMSGFSQPYRIGNYTDSSNNLCLPHVYNNGEDGCILSNGQSYPATSTNDVIVEPNSQTSLQAIGIFSDGQGTGNNPFTATNDMVIFPIETGMPCACGAGIQLGDTNAGLTSLTQGVFNSLFYGGDIGIFSANTANTFLTSGTGGVGVAGNDGYGISIPYATTYGKAQYLKIGTSANYDDGSHTHPSATYGDLTVNPFIYDMWGRTWARCDELLNSLSEGSGTAAHLFGQLFLRWNGTNGPISALTVYRCMVAPYVPQTGALGNPSSYIGAAPPWIGNAGVQ